MLADLPTALQIAESLKRHPDLAREVLRRLIYTCEECQGDRYQPNENMDPCEACGGTGSLPVFHLMNTQIQIDPGGLYMRPSDTATVTFEVLIDRRYVRAVERLVRRLAASGRGRG